MFLHFWSDVIPYRQPSSLDTALLSYPLELAKERGERERGREGEKRVKVTQYHIRERKDEEVPKQINRNYCWGNM